MLLQVIVDTSTGDPCHLHDFSFVFHYLSVSELERHGTLDCVEQAPAVEASETGGGLLKVRHETVQVSVLGVEFIDDAVETVDNGDEILGLDLKIWGGVVGIRHE